MSWDDAEGFLIDFVKFGARAALEASIFLVLCAFMAWGVMCSLGAVHLDVQDAVPAPGFIVTWIVVTTIYVAYALAVWVGAYIKDVVK